MQTRSISVYYQLQKSLLKENIGTSS